MRWSVNGKQQRQSSGTDSMKEAEDMLLHKRAGKEKAEKHSIGWLLDNLILDYTQNSRSVDWCRQNVEKHLRPYFGQMRITSMEKSDVLAFRTKMTIYGYAPATVNRAVALLKRSFKLLDYEFPSIEQFDESKAVRQGFVEDEAFWKIYAELIDHAKPLSLYLYETGCRYSEGAQLEWEWVSMRDGMVR
ncbi:MAG: hypothetical protein LAQ30_20250, partial [Acidobacteriia bacterium]|nr:hypothetical protein [Terriglobia bacterium]